MLLRLEVQLAWTGGGGGEDEHGFVHGGADCSEGDTKAQDDQRSCSSMTPPFCFHTRIASE